MINLDTAKKMALQNNPDYLAKQAAYESAKWDNISSFSSLLPTGTLSASQAQTKPGSMQSVGSDETNSRFFGISFQQPLFMGGKKWLGYRMSSYSQKMSYLTMQASKLETIYTIEEKYFNVLEALDLLKIMEQQISSVQTTLESAQVKFDMGMISKADLLRFQADRAAKETDMILRKNRLQLAIQDFKNTLQYKDNFTLEPVEIEETAIARLESLPYAHIETIIQTCIELMNKQNFTLQTLKQSKKIASTSVLMTGGNFLPSIQLSISKTWQKSWDETMKAADVNYNDSEEIRLSASLPLFPVINNAADYASARKKQKKVSYELISAQNSIELAIESAVLTLVSNAKTVSQADISLRYADEFYQQMEERFRNGMISGTDLLDAEVMLKNAKFAKTNGLYNFLKSKSTLMKLISLENESEMYQILFK
jgi:outer membrane protein TolC